MDLSDLNDKQREIVLYNDGPILVVAGAGSGKTKALTYKIAYLLQDKGFKGSEIFAVTFTNKAANEMKDRIGKIVGERIYFPYIGTFHSVFLSILKKEGDRIGLPSTFVIFDEDDQRKIVTDILKNNLHINEKISPVAVLSYISRAKSSLVSPESYPGGGYFEDIVSDVYPRYQKVLEENNAIDFDDILVKSLKLLKSDDGFRSKFQGGIKYILVDEYQDTNDLQHQLIKAISSSNVCFVGDPDQNIYSWRGTNIRNILSFEKDFPGGRIILMEQNYRSTKIILAASECVIARNKLRYEKKLWTENELGHPIKIYCAYNEDDEVRYITESIDRYNLSLSDTSILYRTNAQSRAIEDYLMRNNIPYRIFGGQKFYQRKEIKDIVAYIRYIFNPDDTVSLSRIINTPPRKIGKVALSKVQQLSLREGISLGRYILSYKDELPDSILRFVTLIESLCEKSKSVSPKDFIEYIVKLIGYEKYVLQEGEVGKSRMENIYEFIGVASKYEDIETLLLDISLVSMDEALSENTETVTLMSLHNAKGLEFDNVFIVGMEEGIFPHSRSMDSVDELEEERRLCYVGMTRAKKRLFLTYAQRRSLYGYTQNNIPSRFLEDISDEFYVIDEY